MSKENKLSSLVLTELAEDNSGDMLQLINPEQEGDDDKLMDNLPEELPVLPIKNTVLFPGVVIPITVGRKKSVKLVKQVYEKERIIGVVAQKQSNNEDPGKDDIYQVGTIARIIKMIVLPDGNITIIIQGKKRFKIDEFVTEDPYLKVKHSVLEESFPADSNENLQALVQSLKDSANKILKLNPDIPQEAQVALDNIESTKFLTHFLCSNINAEVDEKQKLLEINDGFKRASLLLEYMMRDIKMLEIKQEIQNKVHVDIDQQQRDYYLRQQIRILQDELGQEGPEAEIEELRLKGEDKNWPDNVHEHFNKELDKILRLNPQAAEYPVLINYCELLLELPWNELTEDNFDLKRAKEVLDKDHYGLTKVKERIIEYLAVLKLKKDMKAPILCLYGPPGVGKTSLGRSVARALNRKYVRMSLGGVHDEAEIRGHRKTYVGAMPGKIIQNIKRAESSNPVFILDEIDKLDSGHRGDPSSALLEVLDPEQNSTFSDNFLEIDYDLSKVLFIATANSLESIPAPLRDRMEIIEITGYTHEEKVEIAKKHLIPKQRKEHGLKAKDVTFAKAAIDKLINGYTRESGVRNLERKVGSVIRNIAKSIALEEEYDSKITPKRIIEILGPEIFDQELYENNKYAGVVTGLAWTPVGGDILFIESSLSKGKGKLTLSGQLGDVMKESAVTALSYLKSNADDLNIDQRLFNEYDLHVHVPAGAVPKDGPSAGITMLTSLASIYTQRKVKDKLAMTGEITLRGKVLPVGGIKEKILAAGRAGIKEIIMCSKNRKDLKDIEPDYIKNLKFHFIDTVDEVLNIALLKSKVDDPMIFTYENNSMEKTRI
ncbi:endopeptidase La [Marinigracilibium pacificum]|uniref:Lon protease n=1 Tax=Marinigracilibium pacificum TaxID=2729599 RepID=A0A848J1Q3_9BACT|nr:endopeptidase La [Marinigracilibium pacificum]NMM49631.1 endopeptidase La [Marinigracilibium pacificum]